MSWPLWMTIIGVSTVIAAATAATARRSLAS